MDMIKRLISSKYIKWISFALLLLYSASPFINGLGCDYQQQYERGDFSFHSTCKFGYVKSIAHNEISGETLKHSGFIGRYGDTVILIANNIEHTPPKFNTHHDIFSAMNNDFLYIAKIINRDSYDWVIMTYPYYRIQKVHSHGKQSLW